jgi:hypothetical protein
MDSVDKQIFYERIVGGPKKTRITIKDSDTGEIKGIFENKVLITGAMFNAMNIFNVDAAVELPNYNNDLGLENTLDYSVYDKKNTPFVCLFCVDDSGCGEKQTDVFTCNYTDRISPKTIMPFRYVDSKNDISADLRKYYFGRKVLDNGKIGYYFKGFDSDPQLHLRYSDGTKITDQMYLVNTEQTAECYVETRLKVSRLDFRDYFEQVLGWDKARISSISLCFAWYDDTIDDYKWYQQIYPYTKLNFAYEPLVDLTKSIDFVYDIFY